MPFLLIFCIQTTKLNILKLLCMLTIVSLYLDHTIIVNTGRSLPAKSGLLFNPLVLFLALCSLTISSKHTTFCKSLLISFYSFSLAVKLVRIPVLIFAHEELSLMRFAALLETISCYWIISLILDCFGLGGSTESSQFAELSVDIELGA